MERPTQPSCVARSIVHASAEFLADLLADLRGDSLRRSLCTLARSASMRLTTLEGSLSFGGLDLEPHQGHAETLNEATAAWRKCWDSADVPIHWPPSMQRTAAS